VNCDCRELLCVCMAHFAVPRRLTPPAPFALPLAQVNQILTHNERHCWAPMLALATGAARAEGSYRRQQPPASSAAAYGGTPSAAPDDAHQVQRPGPRQLFAPQPYYLPQHLQPAHHGAYAPFQQLYAQPPIYPQPPSYAQPSMVMPMMYPQQQSSSMYGAPPMVYMPPPQPMVAPFLPHQSPAYPAQQLYAGLHHMPPPAYPSQHAIFPQHGMYVESSHLTQRFAADGGGGGTDRAQQRR
jgi:hypothetical protein